MAVDAASLGGLYALTALGVGLVFGVMGLVNFAHGELITVAAYAIFAALAYSLPLPVVICCGLLAAMFLAVATERIAMRPLRGADATTLLVSSFAVSVLIQKTLVLFVGARPKGLDFLADLQREIAIGDVSLPLLQIVTIVTCGVLLVGLTLFLRLTRFGLQMRAAAEDFQMARLLGVRADRVIAAAFAISGALAGIVSILFVAQTGLLQPRMGVNLVNLAFVSTVVGGLGSLAGATLGGFLVGAASVLFQTFLPSEIRGFREGFVFAAVILVLLVRPEGLLPQRDRQERV